MRSKGMWIITIVLGVILLLVLLPVLWTFIHMWQYDGMMGSYGMMGRSYGYMTPFGGFGMALMWLLPIALLVLLIWGAANLVNSLVIGKRSPAAVAPAALSACPNCGKTVQADWNNCPYCGQGLS